MVDDSAAELIGPQIGDATRASRAGSPIDFGGTPTDVLHGQLPRLPREVDAARARGERFLLVAEEEHHGNLAELLAGREVPSARRRRRAGRRRAHRGFRLPPAGVVVFGEPQLWPRRPCRRRRAAARAAPAIGAFLSGLRDLKVGDYVVHVDHGIGQFLGLRTVAPEAAGAGRAARHPARRRARRRRRRRGDGDLLLRRQDACCCRCRASTRCRSTAASRAWRRKLDQLGGASWNKTKDRVKKSVKRARHRPARALRAAADGARRRRWRAAPTSRRQFVAAFAYDETDDQLEAIAAIFDDLAARAADGPPAVRRRRLRQDRGGDARRLPRRRQRLPGGRAGADHHPRRPAPGDLPQALRRACRSPSR